VLQFAVGVGHSFANSPSFIPAFAAFSGARLPVLPHPAFHSLAIGVGTHKPESFAAVRGSNIGSSEHCPSAVIPERGQVTEDNSESPSKQSWAVFHERETGSNFANDPRHVSPHA
jgi:hypothetical protein